MVARVVGREGLVPSPSEAILMIRGLLQGRTQAKDGFTCVLRAHAVDADAEEVLRQAAALRAFSSYCVISADPGRSHELLALFPDLPEVRLVDLHDTQAVTATLVRSRLVVTAEGHEQKWPRILARRTGTWIVRIPHGITTKTLGRSAASRRPAARGYQLYQSLNKRLMAWGEEFLVVGSDFSRLKRMAETRYPSHKMTVVQLPRFDLFSRIAPAAPCKKDASLTVLIAPTRKTKASRTVARLLTEDFTRFAHERNISILYRGHITEEASPGGHEWQTANSDEYPSLGALLPQVDVLVTDTSSIYVDTLPFDIPLIFFEGEGSNAVRAVDSVVFFPGPTVTSGDGLAAELSNLLEGNDAWGVERALCKTVLVGGISPTEPFIRRILGLVEGGTEWAGRSPETSSDPRTGG